MSSQAKQETKGSIVFVENEDKPSASTPSDKTPSSTSSSSTEPNPATNPSEAASQEDAYDPETGEINWDCPCLENMTKPPCGEAFKAAFSCFVYSKAEPKGVDCIEQFREMQKCFREHPEIYGEELEDDDDDDEEEDEDEDEQKGEAPERTETGSKVLSEAPASAKAEATKKA